ncbi:MAG: TIGR04255 family protein [Proteobacteria bacterium]|nr:TIGR04255 family protein [Pseudomonadota bacterium]
MTEFQYKRAPITEAIVEFRSAIPVDEKKRKKALKKLSQLYENHNPFPLRDIKLEVNREGETKTKTTESTLDKFSSNDMTQQLQITDISFGVSQLAPYNGWEQYYLRIKRDWETWRRTVSFRPIERAGMRYINRIDLPLTGSLVHYEDYLEVYPEIPALLDPTSDHSLNVRVRLTDIESVLNLKSAVVESPLPDHMAIVLDLDIGRTYQTPPDDEELYSFISQARIKKNEIFEACITDKARELFS